MQHYNHIANQNKAANQAAYKQWVESYTPDEIQKAQKARSRLKILVRQNSKTKISSAALGPIKDDRQVKRPSGPYILFFKERVESGDMKDIAFVDAPKLVAEEWKNLSQGEKKVRKPLPALELSLSVAHS